MVAVNCGQTCEGYPTMVQAHCSFASIPDFMTTKERWWENLVLLQMWTTFH